MAKWALIVFGFVNSYKITLFAGTGQNGRYDDTTLKSKFNEPLGLIIDEFGWMMIADSANNVIRGIPMSSNTVYTFAGSGIAGTSNGDSASASFNTPVDVCYSSYDKFVYVADKNNHMIRGIGLDDQVVKKAGTGVAGFKNGNGAIAQFSNPSGLAVDKSGIIYVADTGNSVIRKIATDGTVSTLAGSGSASFGNGLGTQTGFNQPIGLAIDSTGKLLYVADTGNNLIRLINMTDGIARVSTIAGNRGPPPDTINDDYFDRPSDVDLDSDGNLYVTDSGNAVIKKLSRTGSLEILTFSESSDYTGFKFPYAIYVASLDKIYVSDKKAHKIYEISQSTTVSSTLSGASATSTSTPISSTVKSSSTTSKSITTTATISQPTKTSSSPQASSTYGSEILSDEKLIATPFFLQSDFFLASGTISEPFQVSFDIVITARIRSKGYILSMIVASKEYFGIYLQSYSSKLTVSMESGQGLARRQYPVSYSASVNLNLNQNQTITITIGSKFGSLFLDGRHVLDFLSYGTPSGNTTIKSSPSGSSVAEASINNLVISSASDLMFAEPIRDSAGSADIVLILGCTIGSIVCVAGLVFFAYRYKRVNIHPPEANNYSGGETNNYSGGEANTDSGGEANNYSGGDGQINNQATERRSRRRERSRRRAQEQNQQPEEPAPPQYTEYTDEPPPLYLSNINLFDSS